MKILAICASLRKDSFNRQLLHCAIRTAKDAGATVDELDLKQFPLPAVDEDIQPQTLDGAVMRSLVERFRAADSFLIATPEYNFSYPGHFKNTFDWLSRVRPMPFTKKTMLLLSASPSMIGGNRGLWALRVPFEACGTITFPEMFSLAQANAAFDAQGGLKNADLAKRLDGLVRDYVKWAASNPKIWN